MAESATPAPNPGMQEAKPDLDAQIKELDKQTTDLKNKMAQNGSPGQRGKGSDDTQNQVLTLTNGDGTVTHYDPALVRFQTNWMLGFSSMISVIVLILLWRKVSADAILRALMIPVIVGTASLLVIAGYGKDQITPIVGLLGTIAGYILGQSHTAGKSEKEHVAKDEKSSPKKEGDTG